MPAGWAAAAVGVVSAISQSNSASDATDAQTNASNNAIAAQNAQYAQTRTDQTRYREAGYQALGQLQTDINKPTTAADVMSDPGYQFGLQQGQLGLDRKAAAGGGRVSGAALKAASSYATDYATTGYNAAYQRGQDRLNRLASLAQIGQVGTQSSALSGNSATNQISNLISAQGNANAAGQIAQGNIWANAGNQLAATARNYANQPQTASTPGYVNPVGGTYQSGSYGGGVDGTAQLPW